MGAQNKPKTVYSGHQKLEEPDRRCPLESAKGAQVVWGFGYQECESKSVLFYFVVECY